MASDVLLREPYLPEVPDHWPMADALRTLRDQARCGVCETGRYGMRYFEIGDGPPVVIVHGLSDRPAAFAQMMVNLSSDFRCIAYEWPEGHGDGAKLSHYRHADLVADLFRLIDHLGLDQATPLGCSLGSTVVLAALAADADRLPRGILQGPFAHRPLHWPERLLTTFARYFPGNMGQLPLQKRMQRKHDYPTFAECEPGVWEYFGMLSASSRNAAVARRARMLDTMDLRPKLPGIEQPVLVMGAEDDRVIGIELQRAVYDALPDARWVEMEGCGHFPHYITPDRMADAARDFLNGP